MPLPATMFSAFTRKLLSCACLVFMVGAGYAQPAPKGTIRIAQSAAFTGLQAEIGLAFSSGAMAAFSAVNAAGGVNGQKIELKSVDDGYDANKAVENTKRMLSEGVAPLALFGYTGSPSTKAVMPLAEANGIVLLAPISGSDGLQKERSPHVFFVRGTYSDEINRIVQQLEIIGIRRVAVFYQDDGFGKGGLGIAQEALAKAGFHSVAAVPYNPQSADLSAAAKAVHEAKVQAVLHIASARFSGILLKELVKVGEGGGGRMLHYGVSIVSAADLLAEAGNAAHGFVIAQRVPNPAGSGPAATAFRKALKDAGQGKYLSSFAAMEGYVSAQILIAAIKQVAGPRLDRAGLRIALEQMSRKEFDSMVVSYDPGSHRGSRFVDFFMVRRDNSISR